MSKLGKIIPLALLISLLLLAPGVSALESEEDPDPREIIQRATAKTKGIVDEAFRIVEETAQPDDGSTGDGDSDDKGTITPPGVKNGLVGSMGSYGALTLTVAMITGLVAAAGIFLTSRYATPKEVLKKPQRAMLYGCIKGNPGVNLKQLSEDFDMKTSTVLWHIRKLEAADLVRSQKANGLRVFYPVAGGIAAKRLGLAVATVSNPNAARILDYIAVHPGVAQKNLVQHLEINAGTVRWHLRKLKDMGLMAELSQGRMCTYYATELGLKALKQAHGISSEAKAVPEFVTQDEAERVVPS
jgi:predicted transcriptional regulator